MSNFMLAYMEGRTYGRAVGRSDGSDVITKPKFLALMGLPKSLSYGAPPRAPAARARAPLKILSLKAISVRSLCIVFSQFRKCFVTFERNRIKENSDTFFKLLGS